MPFVRVKVERVMLDPVVGAPVLVLREAGGDRVLPIGIGQVEAMAIAAHLEAVPMARPMTHDLLRNVVDVLGARVNRVTVTALREGVFYAELALGVAEREVLLDARPSDGVALALRAGAPIFVDEGVLASAASAEAGDEEGAARAGQPAAPKPILAFEPDGSDDLLEGLSDEDFGKWKM
jgi:hypothetical protein